MARKFHIKGKPSTIYTGKFPRDAAIKAANSMDNKSGNITLISMSHHPDERQEYSYTYERKKAPKTITINGKDITFNYSTKVYKKKN